MAWELTVILRFEETPPDDGDIEYALDCTMVERVDEEEV